MPLGAAGLGAWLTPAELALRGLPPQTARALVGALHVGGLAAALALATRLWARDGLARFGAALAAVPLILATLAAGWDDPGWRTYHVPLREGARHEIALADADRARLDAAREAYLVLDLDLPGGDPRGLRLRFDGGLSLGGRDLHGTMPRFALATLRFGHSPESLPQWWATPWRPEMAAGGRVAVELGLPGPGRLRGELEAPAGAPGLSLGQWPLRSVYRLMHDGEYRLPAPALREPRPRRSEARERALPGLLGVRLVVLDDDAGGGVWETAPAPADEIWTAVWARAGRQARAELQLPGGMLRLDFEHPGDLATPAGAVRFEATGEFEGWYLIRTRAAPGRPLRLAVRPLHEMSAGPKYFLPELRADPPPAPPEWRDLPFVPAVRVLEAREAPRWRPVAVY